MRTQLWKRIFDDHGWTQAGVPAEDASEHVFVQFADGSRWLKNLVDVTDELMIFEEKNQYSQVTRYYYLWEDIRNVHVYIPESHTQI